MVLEVGSFVFVATPSAEGGSSGVHVTGKFSVSFFSVNGGDL